MKFSTTPTKFRDFSGKAGVIIGTGPSLTECQLDYIAGARSLDICRVFSVNNAFKVAPFTDVFMACNIEWWDYYSRNAEFNTFRKSGICDLWTWDKDSAQKYGLNHIKGRWGDSFSTDPEYIHYGHSAGFQILNLAYHYGIRKFLLVGYDMRYLPGYDRGNRKPGKGRHFFGEYPGKLQHWPKVGPRGEFTGLLKVYKKLDTRSLGVQIINCSPGSALDFFDNSEIENVL